MVFPKVFVVFDYVGDNHYCFDNNIESSFMSKY